MPNFVAFREVELHAGNLRAFFKVTYFFAQFVMVLEGREK